MAELASCFGQSLQLPPSPLIIAGSVGSPGPPNVGVDIDFNQDMDQASLPPLSVWEFDVDGSPEPANSQVWQSATRLRVGYFGSVPGANGFVHLLTSDPGLRCLIGAIAKAPQSQRFFP